MKCETIIEIHAFWKQEFKRYGNTCLWRHNRNGAAVAGLLRRDVDSLNTWNWQFQLNFHVRLLKGIINFESYIQIFVIIQRWQKLMGCHPLHKHYGYHWAIYIEVLFCTIYLFSLFGCVIQNNDYTHSDPDKCTKFLRRKFTHLFRSSLSIVRPGKDCHWT